METLLLVSMLAIVVEALVEYGKSIAAAFSDGSWKRAITQLAAIVTAIALCVATRSDLMSGLGLSFCSPVIGEIITGIFASRGSNYVSDIVGRIQQKKGESVYG